MIAFNFNIAFIDEPSLQDNEYNPQLKTIKIVPAVESTLQSQLKVSSEWATMSGRKVIYRAKTDFSLSTKTGSLWALEIKDVATLFWSIDKLTIHYQPQAQFSPDRLRFWICHTVLPLKFSLEKYYEMLHVGSVEVAGRPIFFSAQSFGGKSTLTDYFIQQGHALYSDDSLAIHTQDNKFYAIASYPFHRPYRELEVLGYAVKNIARQVKPLHAGYILKKAAADAMITIEELKGVEKYKAFHFSSFIELEFFKDQHFLSRSALAGAVSMYKITVPWDLERLPEVYNKIVTHNG